MSETILTVHNWKQFKDISFDIKGPMISFIGRNGSGKSSAIQALETILLGKGFVKTPIKVGEKNANLKFEGYDLNKNPITITCNIQEGNEYLFSAAYIKDGKAKTITDVKKIRELMGDYFQLTVEDTLNMVKYAEGRRKFIDDYLNTLIDPIMRTELTACMLSVSNKSNKNTENNLYHTRTKKNKELDLLIAEIQGSVLSDDDKNMLTQKESVSNRLKTLKEEYELHKHDSSDKIQGLSAIETIENKLVDIDNAIIFLLQQYNIDLLIDKGPALNILAKFQNDIRELYSQQQLDELNSRIQKGSSILGQIEMIEKKQEPTEKIAQRDKLFKEIEVLNATIEKNKARIKEIYSISKFPAGLEIEEDKILLNGFELDETTNSNTECRMAVLELLSCINTSDYINLGDWSLFDDVTKKKVLAIAEKDNRTIIGQTVSNNETVELRTIICN